MPLISDPTDPKGLIHESYRIEGISAAECRSIFLDWAISAPDGAESTAHVRTLLQRFAPDYPDHPMTIVLKEALAPAARPKRRGGAKARRT